MAPTCPKCEKTFTLKSNLTRHLRIVHDEDVERLDIQPHEFDTYQYKCLENCNISFKYNRDLRNHLKTTHDMNLIEDNFEFPNKEEFSKWLRIEENDNCVQYIHTTASKRKSSGEETLYFECNRSGKQFQVDDSLRKRKTRKRGTRKSGRGCTSQIIVNIMNDGVHNVNYYKSHYGHKIELQHLKLSKQDRGTIATKLLLGVPINYLINSCRNENISNKRLSLLDRKDVFNIKTAYNIPYKDGKLESSNIVDINLFVTECSRESFDPVLHFQVQSDVVLILMTHHQYQVLKENGNNSIIVVDTVELDDCDFELTTLFVVCESRESFPVACMISNRKDDYIYSLFFNKIYEKVGKIAPNVFISDVNELLYNSWKTTMGEAPNVFYNSWQIDLNWKRNLNRICCVEVEVTKLKRKWVEDTLTILRNIAETSEFNENLEETVTLLENDSDLQDFLQYFLRVFHDPKRWAECYRIKTKLDNDLLQTMSDVLKQYVKDGKSLRFDQLFHAIIRFIRDETVNYCTKSELGREKILRKITKKHDLSTKNSEILIIEKVEEGTWNITNKSNLSTYLVQNHMARTCCNLTCALCNVCLHSFSCTCVDFFVGNSICEHIHFVNANVDLFGKYQLGSGDESMDCNNEEIVIEVHDDDTNEVESLKSNILCSISFLATNIEKLDNSKQLGVIKKSLEKLCDFVGENKDGDDDELNDNDAFMNDHSYL